MYHIRLKGSHYEAGFQFGKRLRENNVLLCQQIQFAKNKQKEQFTKQCIPIYQRYYPEILLEIQGIIDGQQTTNNDLFVFLISMYCFELSNHCTCFAVKDKNHYILGRNSDFLVALEKYYMNCMYRLDNVYAFQSNTTAFVQMEDGMNEHGLAIGLTFIYPKVIAPGFNAGMLLRYILEKCKTTKEAISFLKKVPIASQQTFTIIDAQGEFACVECNSHYVEVINQDDCFVVSTNHFTSENLKPYKKPKEIDDWHSITRYQVVQNALTHLSTPFRISDAMDILAGKYGFTCQYKRKSGADTVWSVIYDTKQQKVYRVEGNPSRKAFFEDKRQLK